MFDFLYNWNSNKFQYLYFVLLKLVYFLLSISTDYFKALFQTWSWLDTIWSLFCFRVLYRHAITIQPYQSLIILWLSLSQKCSSKTKKQKHAGNALCNPDQAKNMFPNSQVLLKNSKGEAFKQKAFSSANI